MYKEIKLVKIEVKKLFGFYNYLVDDSQKNSDDSTLLIIYGDNGSGKTTLLKMIFYLLSPVNNSGHKTELCRIKFNLFSITLSDGTIISARRKGNEIVGSYSLSINKGGEVFEVFLKVTSDNSIRVSDEPKIEREYEKFLKQVAMLNITINFLSEDRKLLSFSDQSDRSNSMTLKKRLIRNALEKGQMIHDFEEDRDDTVTSSVRNLESWLKSNALRGTKAGEENANTIYSNLLTQVSNPKNSKIKTDQVQNLLHKIKNIGEESLNFYKSGLMSQIETLEFETALASAKEPNLSLVYNVLEPYIEGLQGRLNSLRPVQDILSKFLTGINDYFTHKTISYNIDVGFKLRHNELNEPIEFSTLSSGERQLLQLFCNVITSSEKSTIFIIDEPEISLNIKWQRKLIRTLLNFSVSKNVQFIFASHSIELLSGHSDSVFKLTNV
ncbi:energy-coupling factor transporter ATP-binding protein EcfA2 [Flavobacterium sp. W4I14]|nr:energy-coupling factor transporter ATP-binding protein EcfA2 [Flavobacterium sp. W4I14]